jgi:hypothetical protein
MGFMKITGYMQLKPEHIAYDEQTRTVRLTKEARGWQHTVFPTADEAARWAADAGTEVYAVTAELPNDSTFEVRGDIDQTEGRGGLYTAGYFADYASAFRAAEGLGVQGTCGQVLIKAGMDRIYTSYDEWKAEFSPAAARTAPRPSERLSIREVVELAPTDESALQTADPEYALWLRLNQKFGAK